MILIDMLPSRCYDRSQSMQLPTPPLHRAVAVIASVTLLARLSSTASYYWVVCYGPCYSRNLSSAGISSVSQLLASESARQHASRVV